MQEHGPFIHILALGTRPEAQGKGFGSQLLRRVLAHADKHLLPVYLEVHFPWVAHWDKWVLMLPALAVSEAVCKVYAVDGHG